MALTIHSSITAERLVSAQETIDYPGFCTACGAEAEGVEPDAERYKCEACGENAVYGVEQLMIMTM